MDQSAKDVSVRSLINTWNSKSPVILIADDSYKYFPYDLAARGYCYVVLGAYIIMDAWREHTASLRGGGKLISSVAQRIKSGNDGKDVVRWMFSFQWCEGQGEPWWLKTAPSPAGKYPCGLFL